MEELAEHLEVPLTKYSGKSWLVVARALREAIGEGIDSRETLKLKKKYLCGLENFLAYKPPPLSLVGVAESTKGTQVNEGKKSKSIEVEIVFRREFKIKGSVGEPGDENNISFVSLARQIESGIERGYPNGEIVESVIRSVVPGIALRSYLEATPDLTLSKLRKILRSYFRESSATELFQQLTTITQSQNKDPQTFLVRALELHQKILFVSKELDASVKYDKELVQNLFVHSVETGLRDDVNRVKIRSHLQTPKVSDDLLISKLNKAAATEMERKFKFGQSKQRTPKVVCKVDLPDNNAEKKPNKLLEQVASMQTEISSLREAISSMSVKSSPAVPKSKPKHPKTCEQCEKSSITECKHCFHCGSDEHFVRDCKKAYGKSKPQSGNQPGLQPRDRP